MPEASPSFGHSSSDEYGLNALTEESTDNPTTTFEESVDACSSAASTSGSDKDEEEIKEKKESPLKLRKFVLDYFRFYSSAAQRNMEFAHQSQLSQRMLRFLLCSNRIFSTLLGSSDSIAAVPSSFYITSSRCYIYFYSQNICLLAWLCYLGDTSADKGVIFVRKYYSANDICVDKHVVKLIYLAKKLDISLEIDSNLRTRVVDQLLSDAKLKVGKFGEYDTEYLHYGIAPMKMFAYEGIPSCLFMKNDIQIASEIPGGDENWEFLAEQKAILVRESYLAEAFLYPCKELYLDDSNFLALLQYLPLPEMPKLEVLRMEAKFADMFDKKTLEYYEEILTELERVAPNCKVEVCVDTCINCRRYEDHIPVLKKIVKALQDVLELMKARQRLFFISNVNVNMPLSEMGYQFEFFESLCDIVECSSFSFNPQSWEYIASVDDPPTVDGERRGLFNVECKFNDVTLQLLGDKDIEIVE
ncbi:unnamed protein product [Bursaphelenchus xylophilus]|uniref:(pine wood nematode) hypothetical protein n=1 Tax=Bursaphelenchus xylophilus TaxID=6326 RepID=A0A1I7RI70_BURXY|nr:unnamed protein product [Bursaphelenchus xylophilus]CAG9115115.1 unnamed protein product [Bursaphelenchus xylophilus]